MVKKLLCVNLIVCFFMVIAVAAMMPASVGAYSKGPHEHFVRQAAQIFSYPELVQYLEDLVYGAKDEDDVDHIYDNEIITGTHFWDADDNNNYVISHLTDLDIHYNNAFQKAGELLNLALIEYAINGNKAQAYEYLGHVVHLIADMTVPAHAHVDSHILDDAYEDWLWDMDSYPWNSSHAIAAGGMVTIPDSARQTVWSWPREQQPLINLPVGVDLFYLMYTANQYGDYFASDEDDGDMNDRLGWMDYTGWPDSPRTSDDIYDNSTIVVCSPVCFEVDNDNDDDGDLSTIANYSFVYAIRATAAMFNSFRNEFDTVPPTTSLVLEGPAGSHDWFTGDVVMTLGARDRDQWGNWGTVQVTQWRYAGGTGWHTYSDPIFFTSEGIREIEYRSIDTMGNEEAPKTATIRIDKTLPVITIHSPADTGFYLTSGTLTIDFETSDVVSGIYRDRAMLDETVVSDGQTIDLRTLGGHHTLAVWAGDNAGNTKEMSVDFSIRIAATVDFRPDNLNLKSGSDTMAAYIEFPAGYDVTLISVPTVRLVINGWFLSASLSPTEIGDYDRDGVPDLKVKFSRQDLITALAGLTGNITLAASGELMDTTEFYGTETVLVTNPQK